MKKKINKYLAITAALLVVAALALAPVTPAKAVKGPVPGAPFGVLLTNTLQSFDANAGGPPYNASGDKPVPSGYTFTVQSSAVFVPSANTFTVTFPNGTDLSVASTDGSNYQVWDPMDRAFKNASSVVVDAVTNPAAQSVTMTFGNLVSPIPAEDNITVRIRESANIRNPAISSHNLQLRVRINGSSDTIEAVSDSYAVGPSVLASPRTPGAVAGFTINFVAPNDLIANSGTITVTFDKDIGFPASINRSQITLRSDKITNAAGTAMANQVVNPVEDPTIELVGPEKRDRAVKITVPDMDRSQDASGNQGIAAGATVTVIFSASAGLKNPTEGATAFQQPAFAKDVVKVRTSNTGGQDLESNDRQAFLHTPRTLELATSDGALGNRITVTGKGFKNGTQAAVFVDTNGDGIRQPGESELVSTLVGSDDSFTTVFTVTSAVKAGLAGNNIQVVDGQGNSACSFAVGSAGICEGDSPKLMLRGRVEVSPDAGRRGDNVDVTVRDWPVTGVPIDSVTLGGTRVNLQGGTIPASGEVTFRVTVPNGAALGVQSLSVAAGGQREETRFNVGGAFLTPSVTRAVPNQDLTLRGSGFSQGGGAKVCQESITIGGEPVTLRSGSVDGSGFPCSGNSSFVNVGSGGTFVASVTIPVNSTTLRPGIHEVRVNDSRGGSGIAELEIVRREIQVSPRVSGMGSTVTITGTGFPADNLQSSAAPQVTLVYDCGGNCTRTRTVTPDISGSFTVTLDVPARVPIPSKNVIRATISGQTPVTTTTHEVPEAFVEVDRESGPSGTLVTVTGTGFQPFTTVEAVEIGGLNAIGRRTFNTDATGRFTADNLVVPGLDPGIHSVVVKIGSGDRQTTANTIFRVTSEVMSPGLRTIPTGQALSPLGNNLIRAWRFDNTTKDWSFYDPSPEWAQLNTLRDLSDGQAIWVNVDEDQTVTVNGKEWKITAGWNLVVF